MLAILLLIHAVIDPVREASSYRALNQPQESKSKIVDGSEEASSQFQPGYDDGSLKLEPRRKDLSIGGDHRSLESLGLNPRGSKYVSSASLIVRANLIYRDSAVRIAIPEPIFHPDDEAVLAFDFDFLRTPTHETRGKPWNGFRCVL